MLSIPAGIELDLTQGRDSAGNLLLDVHMVIATLLEHPRAIAVYGHAHLVRAEKD